MENIETESIDSLTKSVSSILDELDAIAAELKKIFEILQRERPLRNLSLAGGHAHAHYFLALQRAAKAKTPKKIELYLQLIDDLFKLEKNMKND